MGLPPIVVYSHNTR